MQIVIGLKYKNKENHVLPMMSITIWFFSILEICFNIFLYAILYKESNPFISEDRETQQERWGLDYYRLFSLQTKRTEGARGLK